MLEAHVVTQLMVERVQKSSLRCSVLVRYSMVQCGTMQYSKKCDAV